MKRTVLILLCAAVLLSGCAREPAYPADWLPEWTVICPLLAAEPVEGYELLETNDALAAEGIYYAAWSSGEARAHTNEDGEEAKVYDAQIYLIVKQCRSAEKAEEETHKWQGLERENYTLGPERTMEPSGQKFTAVPLLQGKQTNPYSFGMAAFAVRGDWAICVELVCVRGHEEDPGAVMEAFLKGLHYSE